MVDTSQLLEAARIEARSQLPETTSAFTNGMALRNIHQELEADFLLTGLAQNPDPDPLNISNSSIHIFGYIRSDRFNHFQAIKTALSVSEASQAFKDACLILEPLVAEVARLEGVLEAEQRDYGNQLNAIREVQEAATAKAQAALDSDPKIQKMLAAAEAARPSHVEPDLRIFRGRVTLGESAMA